MYTLRLTNLHNRRRSILRGRLFRAMYSSLHGHAGGFLSRFRQGGGHSGRDVLLLGRLVGGRGLGDGLRHLGQHLALTLALGLLRGEVFLAAAGCVHFVGGRSFH